MSLKQDRQPARTVPDLERKYNFGKSFAEILGIATDARKFAEEAKQEVGSLDDSLTADEIFDRLTGSGTAQGIYRENGEIYINASFIKTGFISSDLIKAGKIRSLDFEATEAEMLYPGTLYPDVALYPNNGEEIIRGMEIDFEEGVIRGVLYSKELEELEERIDTLSGFGLGGSCCLIPTTDLLSNYRANGWYYWTAANTDPNKPFNAGSMLCIKRTDTYGTQIAFHDAAYYNSFCVRKFTDGIAGEWEWVNPPMVAGTEYRTTERYEGKPVYVRAGMYTFASNFGDTSTVSNLVVSLGSINATKILRTDLAFSASGTTDRTYTFPVAAASGGTLMVNAVLHNGAIVLISNKYALSAGAVLFGVFYYVK